MRAALALAALLTLAACQQKAEEDSVAASERGQPACEPVMFEDTPLTHCTADPAQHRIRTVLGGESGEPYRSLKAMADDRPGDAPAVAFAMNGGMFDEDGYPVGYYVATRRRLTVLNTNEGPGNFHLKPNGVFYGTGDVLPCISPPRVTRPPKCCPIAWCPRHTPSSGRAAPAQAATSSRLIPASFGVHGPGEIRNPFAPLDSACPALIASLRTTSTSAPSSIR